jgi:ATP-dependent RNA helicase RhlE
MQQRKHTLLFSATLDKTQKSLINDILSNPVTVQVSSGEASSDNVAQDIIKVAEGEDKFVLLKNLLADESFKKVLVFEETKHRVKRLCQKLNRNGLKASDIHGDKSQNQRQNALSAFKAGKVHVLVATDVAARGLDVSDISHVVNYQVPQTYDTYIHRIGRTGRAGKTGFAFTFVD